MSEVIRVVTNKPCPLWVPNARLDLHAVGDRCLKCEGELFIVEYLDPQAAYDAAQSELAALQYKLTAAEQRNADLVELLRDIYNQNELSGFDDRRILAVIQPTESGASE